MIKMTDLEMRNILKGEFNEWTEEFKRNEIEGMKDMLQFEELEPERKLEIKKLMSEIKDYDVQDLNNYLWETVDHDLLWELKEYNFGLYDSLKTWNLLKELGLK